MDGWELGDEFCFLLGFGISSGAMLVLGRVPIMMKNHQDIMDEGLSNFSNVLDETSREKTRHIRSCLNGPLAPYP